MDLTYLRGRLTNAVRNLLAGGQYGKARCVAARWLGWEQQQWDRYYADAYDRLCR